MELIQIHSLLRSVNIDWIWMSPQKRMCMLQKADGLHNQGSLYLQSYSHGNRFLECPISYCRNTRRM